jgi:SAM-dependent methyltransferase
MIAPDEMVSTPSDKRRPGTGLPRHRDRRDNDAPPKQGKLWNTHQVVDAPAAVWGTFPERFLAWAYRELRVPPREVLHVCSGTLAHAAGGVRVDIRAAAQPDIVADGRQLPFRDNAFGAVLIDPPWSLEYARDLYGTEYPRPSHLLAEACRVVRPLGFIGFVHFLVPNPPRGARIAGVTGLTQGCGYRIRAFTKFQKEQAALFESTPGSAPRGQNNPC